MRGTLVRPFELGPVGLWVTNGAEDMLVRSLPSNWDVRRFEEDPTRVLARGDLVCEVIITDRLHRGGAAALRLARGGSGLEESLGPVVRVLGVLGIERWVRGREAGTVLRVPRDGPRNVIIASLDAGAERHLRPLVDVFNRGRDDDAWVRRFLTEALVAPLRIGAEAQAAHADPSLATVERWANRSGISARTLRGYARDAGVPLKGALRWIRCIRAIALYYPPLIRWEEVAVQVGFGSASSLNTSVRATLSVTPGRAVAFRVEHWVRAFVQWLDEKWRREPSARARSELMP